MLLFVFQGESWFARFPGATWFPFLRQIWTWFVYGSPSTCAWEKGLIWQQLSSWEWQVVSQVRWFFSLLMHENDGSVSMSTGRSCRAGCRTDWAHNLYIATGAILLILRVRVGFMLGVLTVTAIATEGATSAKGNTCLSCADHFGCVHVCDAVQLWGSACRWRHPKRPICVVVSRACLQRCVKRRQRQHRPST